MSNKLKKRAKNIAITLIVLLIIVSLISLQYKYSSQSEIVKGLEYQDTIKVDGINELAIFKYDENFIGFTDKKDLSKWLVKGETYDVEYKDRMWHRKTILIIDALPSSE